MHRESKADKVTRHENHRRHCQDAELDVNDFDIIYPLRVFIACQLKSHSPNAGQPMANLRRSTHNWGSIQLYSNDCGSPQAKPSQATSNKISKNRARANCWYGMEMAISSLCSHLPKPHSPKITKTEGALAFRCP